MNADTSPWARAKRILCVRLDNFGDVLMSTPALRALKENRDDCRITLWASPSGLAIAELIPEVDDTLVFEAPWMKVADSNALASGAMIAALRAAQFDAAVIFTVYSQSPLPAALMCHLAGIPLVLAHCRENPYHLLSHWLPETEPSNRIRHEVQRQLDLVASVGARTSQTALSLRTRQADVDMLAVKLARWGIGASSGWVLAHCGATAPSRRYPAERFARVIASLRDTYGQVLLTGSADEHALVGGIAEQAGNGIHNLAGRLTLGEMAALVERAGVLVSNNSGPVHMAAALGTPVVVLYALTNPQHTPWQVAHRVLNHDVPCKFCYRSVCPQGHHACLAAVDPMDVADAARTLMDARVRHTGGVFMRIEPRPVLLEN